MESNWRKSSYSGSNGGECVEVASNALVLVRDTTQHGNGPVVSVGPIEWHRFTASIRASAAIR